MLTLVSFNINGLRARLHQLDAIITRLAPDIIGLQESKVADAAFPHAAISVCGYQAYPYGQKGHYGVALLTKTPPIAVHYGLPGDDVNTQRRLISGQFVLPDGSPLHVINGYFPQGEARDHPTKFAHKQHFYAALLAHLNRQFTPRDAIVLMGDMNVAPTALDIGLGAGNAQRWLRSGKCGFLPEEQAWLQALCAWGLEDSWRLIHPQVADQFTWFDYRSRGFDDQPRRGLRVDLILITAAVRERLCAVGIDTDTRALPQPSDHCPVWMRLE